MRSTSALATGLVVWMVATSAAAQATRSAESQETTRGLALGTGARASAVSSAAIAYNPAGLTLGRLYHIESAFAYHPDAGRYGITAAAVDSITNRVAAGMSFRAILNEADQGHSGYDARVALGIPLSNAISLGVSGRYLTLTREGDAMPGESESDDLASGFTMDAAVRVSPTRGLHLAALAYNVIDLESTLAPVVLGGSAAFQVGTAITVGGDVLFDLTTYEQTEYTIGGGLEYFSAGRIPMRVGYSFDHGRAVHAVTGGLGYVDSKVGVDVSFRRDVSGDDETIVMAAVRYYVQ